MGSYAQGAEKPLVPSGFQIEDDSEGPFQICPRCDVKAHVRDEPFLVSNKYEHIGTIAVHVQCLRTGDTIEDHHLLDQYIRCGHENLQCQECMAVTVSPLPHPDQTPNPGAKERQGHWLKITSCTKNNFHARELQDKEQDGGWRGPVNYGHEHWILDYTPEELDIDQLQQDGAQDTSKEPLTSLDTDEIPF
jgi:hypothetical protein